MIHGTLWPPSHVVALVLRKEPLLPPSFRAREPLSLVKITKVSSNIPAEQGSRLEVCGQVCTIADVLSRGLGQG